jgi:hypothetical protein
MLLEEPAAPNDVPFGAVFCWGSQSHPGGLEVRWPTPFKLGRCPLAGARREALRKVLQILLLDKSGDPDYLETVVMLKEEKSRLWHYLLVFYHLFTGSFRPGHPFRYRQETLSGGRPA